MKRTGKATRLLLCLVMLLSACTLTALAAEDQTGTLICGKEVHVHSADCYRLTCGETETPGHTHTAACYNTEGSLICGRHAHSEACYTLACGQEAHTHTADCYQAQEEQPAEEQQGNDRQVNRQAAAVQALIDALPDTVTADNRAEAEAQLAAIDTAKAALNNLLDDVTDWTSLVNTEKYDSAIAAINALDGQEGAEVPALGGGMMEYVPGVDYSELRIKKTVQNVTDREAESFTFHVALGVLGGDDTVVSWTPATTSNIVGVYTVTGDTTDDGTEGTEKKEVSYTLKDGIMTLSLSDGNTVAIRVKGQMGYTITEETPTYYTSSIAYGSQSTIKGSALVRIAVEDTTYTYDKWLPCDARQLVTVTNTEIAPYSELRISKTVTDPDEINKRTEMESMGDTGSTALSFEFNVTLKDTDGKAYTASDIRGVFTVGTNAETLKEVLVPVDTSAWSLENGVMTLSVQAGQTIAIQVNGDLTYTVKENTPENYQVTMVTSGTVETILNATTTNQEEVDELRKHLSKTVEVKVDAAPGQDLTTASGTLTQNQRGFVTVTNTEIAPYSELRINKQIPNEEIKVAEDFNRPSFTFYIDLDVVKDNGTTAPATAADIRGVYTVTKKTTNDGSNGTAAESVDYTIQDGVMTVSVQAGQTIAIQVKGGMKFTVEEQGQYRYTTSMSMPGWNEKILGLQLMEEVKDITGQATVSGTLAKNYRNTVTVTNTEIEPGTGSLRINKVITKETYGKTVDVKVDAVPAGVTEESYNAAEKFTFQVALTYPAGYTKKENESYTVTYESIYSLDISPITNTGYKTTVSPDENGVLTVKIPAWCYAQIDGLPNGTKYVVSEAASEGYTLEGFTAIFTDAGNRITQESTSVLLQQSEKKLGRSEIQFLIQDSWSQTVEGMIEVDKTGYTTAYNIPDSIAGSLSLAKLSETSGDFYFRITVKGAANRTVPVSVTSTTLAELDSKLNTLNAQITTVSQNSTLTSAEKEQRIYELEQEILALREERKFAAWEFYGWKESLEHTLEETKARYTTGWTTISSSDTTLTFNPDGVAYVILPANTVVVLKELPNNTAYTVEEVFKTETNGVATEANYVVYSGTTPVDVVDSVAAVASGDALGALTEVSVTNISGGSLDIAKTVEGTTTEQEFTFTVELTNDIQKTRKIKTITETQTENSNAYTVDYIKYDAEGNATSGQLAFTTSRDEQEKKVTYTGTVTLKDGEHITLVGLPDGMTYQVTETAVEHYTAAAVGSIGTIAKATQAKAAFVNTYEQPETPKSGGGGGGGSSSYTVTAKKVWVTDNGGTASDSVKVALFNEKGAQQGTARELNAGNNWTASWTVSSKTEGWTVKELEVPEGFTATVTDSGWNGRTLAVTVTNDDVPETTTPDQPANPTTPTEPTEPTNPTEPTDSTEPTSPGEPTNPTVPAEPAAVSAVTRTSAGTNGGVTDSQLPQTGQNWLTIGGLLAAGGALLLAAGKKRTRE